MSVEAGLRVLLVEDSLTDAELIVRCLHRHGLVFSHRRVETAEFLVRALPEFAPDILLCDNRLPSLDALSAIQIAVGMRPDLPIIIVTGTLEDEAAAGLIKAGAVDFVRKDRLGRLPVAVTSAVESSSVRRDRREQEAKLRESELMLRLALGATNQGVWRWEVGLGTDGFEWDATCRALLGLASDTPMNYAVWANAIHVTDRAASLAGMDLALDPTNGLDEYVCDFRVARGAGPDIWLAASGRAVFEPNPTEPAGRKPVRILGTIRDVSRAKLLEREREATLRELEGAREAAEQASRAKSRFLAGVSHELRTPLNGVMGYAHLLQMEGGLSPVQSGRVEAMLAASKHLLELIACVLDLSEIEAEHVTLRKVQVDPQAIVTACLDVVRPTAETKGLALSLAMSPDTPGVLMTDPARLRQVLLNLLGNAVKFTSQGSIKVSLGMSADGSELRIGVADTGPGIPAEQAHRLFEEFERLETEATSKIEGAGLGLAVARQIAALMGGRLGYENNPGGGSVFWLELPVNTRADALPDVEPASPPLMPPTRALHVLVVDDVPINRDIAGAFLHAAGHEATCAEGGAEAIEAVATMDFDVVLMDVRMPEMDGLEATRRIRALEGARGQVPIVALTAQAFTDQIAECRKAGMDSHLAKPFAPDTLLAAVVQAVSAGRRQAVDSPPPG